MLNLVNDEINLLVLRLTPGSYEEIKNELNNISITLGDGYSHLKLDGSFEKNLSFMSSLSLYPCF